MGCVLDSTSSRYLGADFSNDLRWNPNTDFLLVPAHLSYKWQNNRHTDCSSTKWKKSKKTITILITIYFNKESIRILNFLKRNLRSANETTKTSAYPWSDPIWDLYKNTLLSLLESLCSTKDQKD